MKIEVNIKAKNCLKGRVYEKYKNVCFLGKVIEFCV